MTGGTDRVALRSLTGGTVSFGVDEIHGRRVVLAEISGKDRGSLRPADGENLAVAARTARDKRLPLVCFVASSGAAVDEGVGAVHGWGHRRQGVCGLFRCSSDHLLCHRTDCLRAGPATRPCRHCRNGR